MRRSTIAIAVLVATNTATGAIAILQARPAPREFFADQLQDLRLSTTTDGRLRARLQSARTDSSVTIAFSPHAAVQFHHEMGRMFVLIQQEAARSRSTPAPSAPPDSL